MAAGGNCLKDELICPEIMQSVTSKLHCSMLSLTNPTSLCLLYIRGQGREEDLMLVRLSALGKTSPSPPAERQFVFKEYQRIRNLLRQMHIT